MAKVDKSAGADACWPYTGYIQANGYGKFAFQGGNRLAHRVTFLLLRGEIPDGMEVSHACDNRRCCNPGHLRLEDHQQNMGRAWAKLRGLNNRDGSAPLPGIVYDGH
jgi:hypothetical protein